MVSTQGKRKHIRIRSCTQMFLAALFIITMETKLETSKIFITWKQKKGGMFIQWNIIQQLNKIQVGTCHKNIMLRIIVWFCVYETQERQNYRDGLVVAWGKRGGIGLMTDLIRVMKMFSNRFTVMVIQLSKFTENIEWYTWMIW